MPADVSDASDATLNADGELGIRSAVRSATRHGIRADPQRHDAELPFDSLAAAGQSDVPLESAALRRSTASPMRMHRPDLPVNPYLTIDSQSVDLTAYNGASYLERTKLARYSRPRRIRMIQVLHRRSCCRATFLPRCRPANISSAPDHVLAGLISVHWPRKIRPLCDPWTNRRGVSRHRQPRPDIDRIANDLDTLEQTSGRRHARVEQR